MTRGKRLILGMLAAAIVLDVVYWTLWFADRSLIASERRQAYYDFENAFPLADAWLGFACLCALVALVRSWPSAFFWCICAGAAGLYLFSMDLLYDVQHGIFTRGGGGAFEAVIVFLTLVFSLSVLRFAWRQRFRLLVGRP